MYKRVAVKALRGALIKDKNEGILISSHINQRYFSGLDYTDGYVLILAEKAYLLADFRYIEVARATVDGEVFEVVMPEGRMLTELGVLCAAEGITKLYVEEETVSLADNSRLSEAIGGVEIVGGASAEIEKLRAIKSQAELDKIAAAQRITDAAFEHILGFITPERTEKEVALELEFFMRSHGADGIAFETIAVSGSASSMPHGVPRDVKLERGFLTMDFGAFLDGYCSDMTRTVVIGKADADIRRLYDTVLAAQTAALEYIAEGREPMRRRPASTSLSWPRAPLSCNSRVKPLVMPRAMMAGGIAPMTIPSSTPLKRRRMRPATEAASVPGAVRKA